MATITVFLRALARLVTIIGKVAERRTATRNENMRTKAKSLDKLKKAVRARRSARTGHRNIGRLPDDKYRRD